MSSFYIITTSEDCPGDIEADFLVALYRFTEAVANGAEDVTLKWSA